MQRTIVRDRNLEQTEADSSSDGSRTDSDFNEGRSTVSSLSDFSSDIEQEQQVQNIEEAEEGELDATIHEQQQEIVHEAQEADHPEYNVEFVESFSKRGRSLLEKDGFEFYFERNYADGSEAWRCASRGQDGKTYCAGRIKVLPRWHDRHGRRFKVGRVLCDDHEGHEADFNVLDVSLLCCLH